MDLACWLCLESEGELLQTGCACRGSSGIAHLSCLVLAATHDVDSWTTCPTCCQFYTGAADVGLALARWERVRDRPPEDSERLFVANNLAVALKESAGDNEGALRLMEEVLAVRRAQLGDEHPSTLDSVTNLALQHTEMGNFGAALPLSEEAVAATLRTLGPEHEHYLVSLGSLAALHNSMGNYRAARPLHEEALTTRQRILGHDHLDTLNSTHGLGQCRIGLGEREAGLVLLEEAAASARRVLGAAHPSTAHFERGLAVARDERTGPALGAHAAL